MSAPDTIHISLNLNFVLNFHLDRQRSAHCIFLAYVTDVRQMLVARELVFSLYEVTLVTGPVLSVLLGAVTRPTF